MSETWYIACKKPRIDSRPISFPFTVGRGACNLMLQDASASRKQFTLSDRGGTIILTNESMTNPTVVDGEPCLGVCNLEPGVIHRVRAGSSIVLISTMPDMSSEMERVSSGLYFFSTDGAVHGPVDLKGLEAAFDAGTFKKSSFVWEEGREDDPIPATDMIEFPDDEDDSSDWSESAPSEGADAFSSGSSRFVTAEEEKPEMGVSFQCPYCRTVSRLEDVLSVAVSAGLMGDPVLGPGDSQRFLPAKFTSNGLAIDAEGGVCTEIACPHCHMTLPAQLLETPQIVMSVVGARGAGKSFFLASAIWQCRQILSRRFGIRFMDMDPAANAWINDYESKLFFRDDSDSLLKIDKTDVGNSSVAREVTLDGHPVLLPLPSYFTLRAKNSRENALVVYDSAGEHFRPGADTQGSLVTRNMLGADVLYFLFDPSADPRFRSQLDLGSGDLNNTAQRQDTLLMELAARIRRHLGSRGEERLSRPLIVGFSKADMLRDRLPLTESPCRQRPDGAYALDWDALHRISDATEDLLGEFVPEVVGTARDIASEVWFLPMSALGHNPKNEGVRASDVKPVWAEIPVLFTLALRGMVPTVGTR